MEGAESVAEEKRPPAKPKAEGGHLSQGAGMDPRGNISEVADKPGGRVETLEEAHLKA